MNPRSATSGTTVRQHGPVLLIVLLMTVPFSTSVTAAGLPSEQVSAAVSDGITGEEWTSIQAMIATAEYEPVGLTLAAPPVSQQGQKVRLSFDLDTARRLGIAVDTTGGTYPLTVAPLLYSETAKLHAADAEAEDEFGNSLSLSGDTLAVGAFQEDSGGSGAGAVYVFERNQGGGDSWGQVGKLMAGDAQADDAFGFSVSLSGDTLAVGAHWEDSGGSNAGAVYVFKRNQGGADSWGQVAKVMASDAQADDEFGSSVSLSNDTLVIGAPRADSGGADGGAAYVYERNQGGADSWGQVAKIMAGDTQAGDLFGSSVSVSGGTVVVGAYGEDSGGTDAGAAYVFERNQGGADSWGQVAKITASDARMAAYFGSSVSLSVDTFVVGARGEDSGGPYTGAAYVFERNQGGAESWGEVTKLMAPDGQAEDLFGSSVSLSDDALVVGAYGEDSGGSNVGVAYVFERNQGWADSWGQVARLAAGDAQDGDLFGRSVSLSGDTLVVGAYREDGGAWNAGAAYVFTGSGDWYEIAATHAADAREWYKFGRSVSLSGDTLVVGAWGEHSGGTDSGAVYVFERNRGWADGWGQVAKLMAGDAWWGDRFGISVSLSGDTLVVGANGQDSGGGNAGAAYVFERNQGGADSWGQVAKLLAYDAQGLDEFGYSVSISDDTLVVGAWMEDSGGSNAGAAYVFERNADGADCWGQVAKLVASDGEPDDSFGLSVSISGDVVAVGAPYVDSGAPRTGAAYVFERNHGGADSWGQIAKLTAPDAQRISDFGQSVSLCGDTLVAGAPLHDSGGWGSGAAYIFERNQSGADNWGQVAKLIAADAEMLDYFGEAVSLSGDTLVVSAPGEDSGALDAGAVYLFERNQSGVDSWGEVTKLVASNVHQWDRFGYSVSLSGDTLVVGEPRNAHGNWNDETAWVFKLMRSDLPWVDLSLVMNDQACHAIPAEIVTYTIHVSNSGPGDVVGAEIDNVFPAELIACHWTCAATGGAFCTAGPVVGNIDDLADLPALTSVTYTAVCTVDPGASFESLTNTATVRMPLGVYDPDYGNNIASETVIGLLAVFADCFDSGDAAAWSEVVGGR